MKQAYVRVERLLSIENHSNRRLEHFAFDRLVYRNRNQHRHGFYFRRIEYVRKLLSQIRQHIVWDSLKNCLQPKKIQSSRKCRSQPLLSFSSLTIDDLKSVEDILYTLVSIAIPNASKAISLHLISRGHFLPFAVSITACLARIRCQEDKLLSQIRGLVTELNLLLSLENTVQLPNQIHDNVDEDVGECLELEQEEDNPNQEKQPNISSAVLQKNRISSDRNTSSRKKPRIGDVTNQSTKSLYQLTAKHSSQVKSSVVHMPRLDLDNDKTNTHQEQNRMSTTFCETSKVKVKDVMSSLNQNNSESDRETPNIQKHGIAESANPRKNVDTRLSTPAQNKEKSDSESDDIDDIFGDL